ncbi:MAG: energy-coupling factor transporter transmembrane protein EcfT [Selenomonadaceae bacterium]|nr:energy-coupling factor transporter transmembrane protein EcfT [Selenomonadaceae bacterium]
MNITLGQYIDGNSVLHKTDPKIKLMLIVPLVFSLFIFDYKVTFPTYTALILFLARISKIPFKSLIISLKPVWWILAFTLLLNPFFHEGEILFSIFKISATKEGAVTGFVMAYRFALFILLSSFLTLTTKTVALTDAVEDILKPLKLVNISPHYAAMTISLAFRFVPTTIHEYEQIVKAQKSRGIYFDEGGIFRRIKNMGAIVFPLMLLTFQRAEDLSFALEARCYNENRGKRKQSRMNGNDYLAIAFITVFIICNVFLQFYSH